MPRFSLGQIGPILFLLGSGCSQSSKLAATRPALVEASQLGANTKTDSVRLFDSTRNRWVPVVTYAAGYSAKQGRRQKQKVALLNHGYGGQNTAYSFLATMLVAQGYFVASLQHELPGDEPIATTGNLRQTRKPNWERGVQNMLFVLRELQRTQPDLDYRQLLLLGHSNGGDMAMLFAAENPKLVARVISLDNRRTPLPRARYPRVLTLRSNDQVADAGVLPTPAEQLRYGTQVVQLLHTQHNDMWDGATEPQKQEMIKAITQFLEH